MLSVIKQLFIPTTDYAGRNIDVVIDRLAARTGTNRYEWSYLTEISAYENTSNGMRVYPHEVSRNAA